MVGVIPVEVVGAFHSASRRFAHLAWTTHPGHLPMAGEVILQYAVVKAQPRGHGTHSRMRTILRPIVEWSRPFYDRPQNGTPGARSDTAHRDARALALGSGLESAARLFN